MFKIGDFSKLTFVSVRMLRYYDDAGLFKPTKVDEFTGYRYYSAKQISTLSLIVKLRDMGFNVADIALVLAENDETKQRDLLLQKKTEVENEIVKKHIILKSLRAAIDDLSKEKIKMSYQVKVKPIPAYTVVCVRDTIKSYNDEGVLWERLSKVPVMCGT